MLFDIWGRTQSFTKLTINSYPNCHICWNLHSALHLIFNEVACRLFFFPLQEMIMWLLSENSYDLDLCNYVILTMSPTEWSILVNTFILRSAYRQKCWTFDLPHDICHRSFYLIIILIYSNIEDQVFDDDDNILESLELARVLISIPISIKQNKKQIAKKNKQMLVHTLTIVLGLLIFFAQSQYEVVRFTTHSMHTHTHMFN